MTASGTPSDRGAIGAWLQTRWAFAILCLLAMLPLVFVSMPPFTDLAGHLGRFAVQVDGGKTAVLRQWYSFHWDLIPNLGIDLLVQGLAPILGLEPALKLVVVVIPGLQVAGWLLLARTVHGSVPPQALFALPLAYSYPLEMGFLNFSLSAALVPCFLALWIHLGRRGRIGLRWAIFVPLACVIWVTHLVGWVLLVIFAGAEEFMRQRDRGMNIIQAGLRSILPVSCLIAPYVLKHLWPAGDAGHGSTEHYFAIRWKLGYLFMALRDRWALWDIAGAIVILAAIGWSWVASSQIRRGELALGAAVLAALFMVMPEQVYGSAYADMRLVPTMLAMALLAYAPREGVKPRMLEWLLIAGLVFTGVRFVGNGLSAALFDRRFSADIAAVDVVPRESQMVTLVVLPCDEAFTPWQRDRRDHLSSYALARRHIFSNDQWVIEGGQLLQVRNPAVGPFDRDPSQITHASSCDADPSIFAEIKNSLLSMVHPRGGHPAAPSAPAADHRLPPVEQSAAQIPQQVKYLWIVDNGKPRLLPDWHPIGMSTGSVVYARN